MSVNSTYPNVQLKLVYLMVRLRKIDTDLNNLGI
jgi:hypothetical protein